MRNRGAPSKSLATPRSVVRGAPPVTSRVANAPVRATRISRLTSATAAARASLGSTGAFAMASLTLRADWSETPGGSARSSARLAPIAGQSLQRHGNLAQFVSPSHLHGIALLGTHSVDQWFQPLASQPQRRQQIKTGASCPQSRWSTTTVTY